MSRLRFLPSALLLLLPIIASAQTVVSVGTALGWQSYRGSIDNPRILSSLELLVRRGGAGVHVAVEYADLSDEGALIVIHPDLVFRQAIGQRGFVMFGAGPTFFSPGTDSNFSTTWNAEVELGRTFGRTDLFARVRHYHYSLPGFRAGAAGPKGPAIYAGARFRLGR
jgi:hypothetical protein